MAFEFYLVLGDRQRQAGSNADLLANQIQTGDGFGNGMFHLQAGVHLDEEELAVFPQEFDGAGAAIFQLGNRFTHHFAHARPLGGVERRRRGFFQHLLVAALQRTIAFAQMDGAAMAIAEHLEFDVARLGKILLDINGIVAKGGLGFGFGLAHQRGQAGGIVDHLHATAAAARSSLHQHRVTDDFGHRQCFFHGFDRAIAAWHQRQAQQGCCALGFNLVAHLADMFRIRADPGDAMFLHDFGKTRVFGQETIAGVDGISLGDFGRRNDRRDVQIAVRRRRRANADGFIGQPHVHGISVGSGVHRHGSDTHFAAGTVDAQRDFAPVGDQDLLEHRRRLTQ